MLRIAQPEVATLAGLAGCSSDEPADAGAGSGDSSAEKTNSASTSGAGVASASTDSFVEQTVPVEGSETDTVTVGVQSLVVEALVGVADVEEVAGHRGPFRSILEAGL